jgi:hypothetical protein
MFFLQELNYLEKHLTYQDIKEIKLIKSSLTIQRNFLTKIIWIF